MEEKNNQKRENRAERERGRGDRKMKSLELVESGIGVERLCWA